MVALRIECEKETGFHLFPVEGFGGIMCAREKYIACVYEEPMLSGT